MAGLDEQQLLELIESADSDAVETGLRALRADDPQQARRIEAMRRDRVLLQSLPPIDPPVDFLAELEPQIARPMLMDDVPTTATQPGAARRAAHRNRMRSQLMQAAVAASVALTVFVGAWITASSLGLFDSSDNTLAESDNPGSNESQLAVNDSSDIDNAADISNDSLDDVLLTGDLHHRAPNLSDIQRMTSRRLVASTNRDTAHAQPNPSTVNADAQPAFVMADFALVLNSKDETAAQSHLSAAIDTVTQHSAVIKNLTVPELKLIEQAWLARRAANGNPVGPLHAGVGDDPPANRRPGTANANRSFHLNVEMLQESVEQLIAEGLVAGSSDLMPDYDQQIELSEAGLRYTLAIPVSELKSVLARLNAVDAGNNQLVLRESLDTGPNAVQPMAWATDLNDILVIHDRLLREQPDAVLLLPVVLSQVK